jgi:hypothetical protein
VLLINQPMKQLIIQSHTSSILVCDFYSIILFSLLFIQLFYSCVVYECACVASSLSHCGLVVCTHTNSCHNSSKMMHRSLMMLISMAMVMVTLLLNGVIATREYCQQSLELLFCNNIPRTSSGAIDYNLPNGNASKPW